MRPWVLLLAMAAHAEIVDRIAVSIGSQVITESQITEELRITAFLNHAQPSFSPEGKRKAAERLIEQALIKREMDVTHFPLPDQSAAAQVGDPIQQSYGGQAPFTDALSRSGISRDELQRHLWWQVTTLRFIEYRFKPSIQIPDAEIQSYYEKKRVEWEQQGLADIPALEEVRDDIDRILTQERVDQAVDRWLGDTRTQLEIRYHKEAFE